jgi:hypothetical protein
MSPLALASPAWCATGLSSLTFCEPAAGTAGCTSRCCAPSYGISWLTLNRVRHGGGYLGWNWRMKSSTFQLLGHTSYREGLEMLGVSWWGERPINGYGQVNPVRRFGSTPDSPCQIAVYFKIWILIGCVVFDCPNPSLVVLINFWDSIHACTVL